MYFWHWLNVIPIHVFFKFSIFHRLTLTSKTILQPALKFFDIKFFLFINFFTIQWTIFSLFFLFIYFKIQVKQKYELIKANIIKQTNILERKASLSIATKLFFNFRVGIYFFREYRNIMTDVARGRGIKTLMYDMMEFFILFFWFQCID